MLYFLDSKYRISVQTERWWLINLQLLKIVGEIFLRVMSLFFFFRQILGVIGYRLNFKKSLWFLKHQHTIQ